MAKVYDNATDLITFARSSSGTALRRVGYGDELVVDGSGNWVGDFDVAADVSEWSVNSSSTISFSSGKLRITNATSYGLAYQSIPVEVGRTYTVTVTGIAGTAPARPRAGYSAGDNTVWQGPTISSGEQTETFTFTSTGQTLFITLYAQTTTVGQFAEFDNISVREVIFDRATDPLVLFDHPDDIPRIEYAADGSLKGLLIEEQRTNLVTSSAQGIYGNSPGSTQQTTGPDGSTGDYVPVPDGGSDRFEYSIGAGDFANGTELTVSWFAKRLTGTPSSHVGELKLNSHVGVTVGTAYEVGASADGWTRYAATVTVTDNSAQQLVRMYVGGVVAQGAADMAYFGFQLEEGSFATSYIPTAGSTVTRSPDLASIPVSAFGYNEDAGTVVVEFDTASIAAGFVGDQSFATAVAYSSVRDFKTFNGTTTATTTNAFALGQVAKGTVAYDNNGRAVCLNGGTVTSSSGSMQDVTEYKFGQTFGGNYLNGHIKSIQYYPRRLTDAQLQELTS